MIIGDSMRPTPSPNSTFAMKICQTLFAVYIMTHAIPRGTFTHIIARFRPSESVISAEKTLPSGSQIYAILPINRKNMNFQ